MAWTDALGGGLGGAATGATIGSMIFPGIGTLIGAGLGGLGGALAGGYGSSPEEQKQLQMYTPEQQALMNRLGQQGATGLQGILGSTLDSKALEEEAMRQYQQQIIPGLMSTLTSAPTAGLQRSSAFGQQLGAAGTDLATRLAALRSQVAQQQQGLRANIYGGMLGYGLGKQFEPMYKPEQAGFGQTLLSASAPLMQGMGQYGMTRFKEWMNPTSGGSIGGLGSSPEAQWLNAFKPGNFSTGSGI